MAICRPSGEKASATPDRDDVCNGAGRFASVRFQSVR